jgi:hypothetical protein
MADIETVEPTTITLTLKKIGKGRLFYENENNRAAGRIPATWFAGEPETVEMTAPFAPPSLVVPKPNETPEVAQARAVLKAFNAERKEAREKARVAKGLPAKGEKTAGKKAKGKK